MTLRQRLLKLFYPALMRSTKKKFAEANLKNIDNIQPQDSFYDLSCTNNKGETVHFKKLQGKKVLLVNTATDCGFTRQFEELVALYNQFKPSLEIFAFPSNDFKEQEKKDDVEIEKFCRIHYGVNFPLMQKSVVKSNKQQNKVYQWLGNANRNGWNNQAPTWNFSKYLVDEKGMLTHYFGPAESPLSETMMQAISIK